MSSSDTPAKVADIDMNDASAHTSHASATHIPLTEEEKLTRMAEAVKILLQCIGEDTNREGLLKTPIRYAKALLDLTSGSRIDVQDLHNDAFFNEGHGEMVVVKDVEIHSLCEHHMLPFSGKIHIGYIPGKQIIGLSKLARIAEAHSQRLQVQERLTKDVAQEIMDLLKPDGVMVLVEASHSCMAMRGVRKAGTTTTTVSALGCFKEDREKRNEFYAFVEVKKA